MATETEHHELPDSPFRIGDWLVEPRLNRLSRGEESVQIELKMMDVLVCLAERAGELVFRREITDTVWATEFITEKTLTRAVAELRRTLGDDAREPRYIETIHRKGYRLIAPMEMVEIVAATVTPFTGRAIPSEDDRSPYPGLAAFTEDDAEFFYGRESEVTQLWRKITSKRLLALIGPSGVGKSSLLQAGLIPACPEGWGTLIFHPGESAFRELGRALAPELEGDSEAIAKLVDVGDEETAFALVARWREKHGQALLIVDQFEELCILNTPDNGAAFARLLGRLAQYADVHVLLSMRDDFLYRCHEHTTLRPILEDLTALERPNRASLRGALEEPAARLGYAFEDDEMVEEMLDEVAGERSALPFVAFAVARLWDKRDRGRHLLARQAFVDIGGVGGSLARHADATLQAIGGERTPLVRELFRNLVTAEDTRAVRSDADLLSVFADTQREDAAEVLRRLVDARLLTSFQEEEGEGSGGRRIEVAHEALLTNWPRLVGWRAQDVDSARLRDELRQAARTWDEHDRSADFLWTGKAYREYSVWRDNYPGRLTELEEDFASAMIDNARRRRRRRRTAVTAAFVILLAALAIIGGFWRRSVTEARRAEAANLLALAQLRIEDHPGSAFALAVASLEQGDGPDVRRLILDILSRGPKAIVLKTRSPLSVDFSPDGRWLLTANSRKGPTLWPSDGGPPIALDPRETTGECRVSPDGSLVACILKEAKEIGLWSCPEGKFLRSFELGGTFNQIFRFSFDGSRLITSTEQVDGDDLQVSIRSWPLNGGEPDLLTRLDVTRRGSMGTYFGVDPTETLAAWVEGERLELAPLIGSGVDHTRRRSLEHERNVGMAVFDQSGKQLATADVGGTIRVWALDGGPPLMTHKMEGEIGQNPWSLRFDPTGNLLGSSRSLLFNLDAPPNAEPLGAGGNGQWGVAFHPRSTWMATSRSGLVFLWPLGRAYPTNIHGHDGGIRGSHFALDGRSIASISEDGTVRLWPLDASSGRLPTVLYRASGYNEGPVTSAVAPNGSFLAIGTFNGSVWVLPVDGSPARELRGIDDVVIRVTIDAESRLVAAGAGVLSGEDAVVRVWDLRSGEDLLLDAGDGQQIRLLQFESHGDLWVWSGSIFRRWDLQAVSPTVVEEVDFSSGEFVGERLHGFDPDSRRALLCDDDRVWVQNIDTHESRELVHHRRHDDCSWFVEHGIVASVDYRGGIRVGPITGEEPHLLLGHDGGRVTISPDGQWIASGGDNNTVRLWPMPDLGAPPLHTLPRHELIARLKSLTNLRAIRDDESASGWTVEVGPFPGWETVPTW